MRHAEVQLGERLATIEIDSALRRAGPYGRFEALFGSLLAPLNRVHQRTLIKAEHPLLPLRSAARKMV